MSGLLTTVQRKILLTLSDNEVDGKVTYVQDFYPIKDQQSQSLDQFNRDIKRLEVHGCIELTPKPNSANDITPEIKITATPIGKGAISRPHNGHYWLPDVSMVANQTHVTAQIAQIGNNNSITLNLNALPPLIDQIQSADISPEKKKSIIQGLWDFVSPIAQGTMGELIKKALGL